MPNTSWAFSNATINIDGIGEIAVTAVEQNVEAGSNRPTRGIRSRSNSTSELFIQTSIDGKFPELFLKCAAGAIINEATIIFVEDDEDEYSIRLENIIIGSIELSDVSGSEAMLSIGLRFEKIEFQLRHY